MNIQPTLPDDILQAFNVSVPVLVDTTKIANIWKVIRPDGHPAALKVYHQQNMKNERPGLAFLSALDGCAAARVLKVTKGEVLLEWLNGPSLGDLTRQGRDIEASAILACVANKIHSEDRDIKADLPQISQWLQPLFDLQLSHHVPAQSRSDMLYCQNVARRLLASQTQVRPLHGDLHHDNIRLGARGYCAFDAKGVLGEKTYELANAFRNPKGASRIVQSSDRVDYLAKTWSHAFGVEQVRLLEWAMVKIALSISWRSEGKLEDDPELSFLSMFRAITLKNR